MKKSVVLFSGGMDSTLALVKAREVSDVRAAVFVRYDQSHQIQEEAAASRIASKLEVNLHYLSVPLYRMGGGLMGKKPAEGHAHLAPAFVPGRNMILLTLAAGIAVQEGATEIYIGACDDDREGFPDCRPAFLVAAERALRLGLDMPTLEILAPCFNMTKADMYEVAAKDPDLWDLLVYQTHSCYEGDRTGRAWGNGCGNCGACQARIKGYVRAGRQAP